MTHSIAAELEFVNKIKRDNGYYTVDELIKKSADDGFTIENPRTFVKKGAKIGKGVYIKDGARIDGLNVAVGEGTVLENTIIKGSNITIGKRNKINGDILSSNLTSGDDNVFNGKTELDNMVIGDNNQICNIFGNNKNGTLKIGSGNWIKSVKIDNRGPEEIEIGNANELHPGLNINCLFPTPCNKEKFFKIKIGNYNSLGRDGGGVISTSYRYERKWGGPVLIGSDVDTTRGAEILGWSLMGFPAEELCKKLDKNEEELKDLFLNGKNEGNLEGLKMIFEQISEEYRDNNYGNTKSPRVDTFEQIKDRPRSTSLYGVAKIKRSCFLDKVQVKDDVRTLCSFLRNFIVAERCKVYFSGLVKSTEPGEQLDVDHLQRVEIQDRAIEDKQIHNEDHYEWSALSDKLVWKKYPSPDTAYYELK